jgi:hypothetical protein
MEVERRSVPRYTVRMPMRFKALESANHTERITTSLNISRRGLFFLTDDQLERGTPLKIWVEMPEKVADPHASCRCCFGRIVHGGSKKFTDGTRGLGVEIRFCEILPTAELTVSGDSKQV